MEQRRGTSERSRTKRIAHEAVERIGEKGISAHCKKRKSKKLVRK